MSVACNGRAGERSSLLSVCSKMEQVQLKFKKVSILFMHHLNEEQSQITGQ